MLRTIVRDVAFRADFRELVTDLTTFAELSVETAIRVCRESPDSDEMQRATQSLSVVAMGKMGGNELNVSSDIDIVFVCDAPDDGDVEMINRVATRVCRTLDREIDRDFVFRVDTRLRPYGNVGPLVPTLEFLESYFVAQGRMWERIAWLRARVVSGPLSEALSELVTPFVFRRYLDFDAISGMRDLHTQLRAEKTDPNNVKLGRGGIRELEFGVQLRQLLRGGRDSRVRSRNTLDALAALADVGDMTRAQSETLTSHYVFLRRVEHMLQYRDDLQTQTLPSNAEELDALAMAMGEASSLELMKRLVATRDDVANFFDTTLGGAKNLSTAPAAAPDRAITTPIANAGDGRPQPPQFQDVERVRSFFSRSLESSRALALPTASRARLEELSRSVLALAVESAMPDDAAVRSMDLLMQLASRSSYLALLTERPNALRRLVDLAGASEWAVRYIAKHPLLLDELIDARSLSISVDYTAWTSTLAHALSANSNDTEAAMDALRHFQQGETFRLLLKDLGGQLTVETLSDHLSALADVCVEQTLRHLLRATDIPDSEQPAVIAYGKWGSKELGYAGDLDLIFLIPDSAAEHRDTLTRLAQRLQSWLTTLTSAGRAYDIDIRLRPDGQAGLLLSTLTAFVDYQKNKAWMWEHQALTRARFAVGNRALGQSFEATRLEIISMQRDGAALAKEVIDMRTRVASEHPNRDRDTLFDLKHDAGGIVDFEFAVQALVLRFAHQCPTMRLDHGNIALALRASELGLLGDSGAKIAQHAADAYRELRRKQHALRLQGNERARVTLETVAAQAQAIRVFTALAYASICN